MDCIYVAAAYSAVLHVSPNPQPSTSPPSQQPTPTTTSPETYTLQSDSTLEPSSSTFTLDDLALLHQWTLVTSKSILQQPKLDHFWQSIFPSIGFKYAYVIHSLLSISALHDAYLHPSHRRKRIHDATRHHTLALQGFRQALDNLGPHNADAIFASAVQAFFYAFLTFGPIYREQEGADSIVDHTACVLGEQWIPLIRGLSTVLQPVHSHVRSGPLKSLLEIANWYEINPDTVPPTEEDQRMQALREIWQDSEHSQIYDETLLQLRRTRVWMTQESPPDVDMYNQGWSGPFIWTFLVPDKFFDLQRQRQPQALVLFAYYGALLQRMNDFWWMQGCGRCIVEVVDKCLGPYWSRWTDWPKQIVGLAP